ncbi:MAG: hypothetical protein JXR50_07400 [Prolixibacteraceae bacterium]|nr:hypothetical protein [Prolixibacteraceae bacterium]MBN2649549.1 hypothetical protein [Prolixibacteraceae bacterium]
MKNKFFRIPGMFKIINGIVLFLAAIVLILQYEHIISLNIYLIYAFSGILLGLGVIQFLSVFDK